jgi:hypothetical protein
LEGRTPKEKTPFQFSEKITPAKTKKQGVFFFRGCRAKRGSGWALCWAYDLIYITTRVARGDVHLLEIGASE